MPKALEAAAVRLFDDYYNSLSQAERDELILYLTVGSTNMDYRSHVMNAEVMVTVSGFASISGAIDLWMIAGLSEWPQTPEDVDALIPPPGWFTRRLARTMKLGL